MERRRDGPPGDTSGGAPQPASGMQNLVSADGEILVEEREIYTSDSSDSEVAGDGAYGGYEAQVLEGHMPVDSGEYLSDESTDTSFTTSNYRTDPAPTTLPCPREGEGTF